jgi:TonB family protein
VLHAERPVFPIALRQAGITGEAEVSVLVAADGRPTKVRATWATHPLFGMAAETCVRAWWFVPAARAGHPASTFVKQRLIFSLSRVEADQAEQDSEP